MKRTCVQCGKEFEITASEEEFYKQKGLELPKRCKDCRAANKTGKNTAAKAESKKNADPKPQASEAKATSAGGNKKLSPLLLIVLAIVVVVWLFIPSNKSSTSDSVASVAETVAEQAISEADNEASMSDFTEEEPAEEVDAEAAETEAPAAEAEAAAAETTPEATETTAEAAPEQKEYVFRNAKLLNQHYEKHGIEMGFGSAEEYQAAASAVVNNPDALHKTEKEDGDDVYYVEATNEFVIVSSDGYLRTYFNPSAGLDYYNRQ